MEITAYTPGTPCWTDLGSPDPAAAAEFYQALFGWTVIDLGPEAGGYRMCELRGQQVAGIGPQGQPDAPPYWTTYISVSDADATADAIRQAGGQVIVQPMDVMGQGRMGVFTDNAGIPFSIWQPQAHIGSGLVNEPGALCWNELHTRDPEAAKSFYGSVFGWTAENVEMGGTTTYTEWRLSGKSVGGMMPLADNMPGDTRQEWMVCFAVDDADTATAQTKQRGGSVVIPPTDIKPGRFAVLTDPLGASFSVIKLDIGLLGT